MKKALALVLALVLALSMAVSAFALVELAPVTSATAGKTEILVIDMDDESKILYTRPFMPLWDDELTDSYVTYIALADEAYKDIKLTANGIVDAELVKYDPETMTLTGALEDPTYSVTRKGEVVEYGVPELCCDGDAHKNLYTEDGFLLTEGLPYEVAVATAKHLAAVEKVSYYGITCDNNVNVIKLTIDNNFTAAFTEGTLKIEATLNKKPVANTITIINDVSIFEYEEVKWAAANNADGAYLQLGDFGYSDFYTSEYGYSFWFGADYNEDALRTYPCALVVSTTAFRAIEGEDLTLSVFTVEDVAEISVTLKDIVKGQKGVNFFAWADLDLKNVDDDRLGNEKLVAASFGFMGDQVIKGEFEITVDLPIDYYDLREAFGKKVEEEDIITYYILKNGKAFDEFTVDYMTDDIDENVSLTIKGENEKLGWYTLALEVPAEETEEENPNTGAESVVGVVAALAVVSVATAAAVSLKK